MYSIKGRVWNDHVDCVSASHWKGNILTFKARRISQNYEVVIIFSRQFRLSGALHHLNLNEYRNIFGYFRNFYHQFRKIFL